MNSLEKRTENLGKTNNNVRPHGSKESVGTYFFGHDLILFSVSHFL